MYFIPLSNGHDQVSLTKVIAKFNQGFSKAKTKKASKEYLTALKRNFWST